jgi:hypothetical protein
LSNLAVGCAYSWFEKRLKGAVVGVHLGRDVDLGSLRKGKGVDVEVQLGWEVEEGDFL